MSAFRPVSIGIVLATLLLVAAGCGSCDDTQDGQPWSVDASESDASDVAEDAARDTSDDMQPDTNEADADATSPLACLEIPGAECPTQNPNSYGDCAMPLGVVFDGEHCVPASGCGCEGDDCPAFDSLTECALECVGAGACTEDEMPLPAYGSTPTTCSQDYCGEKLTFCVVAESDPVAQIKALVPDHGVSCAEDGQDCVFAAAFGAPECRDGDWCCSVSGGHGLERLSAACAAALLPGVQRGACYDLE